MRTYDVIVIGSGGGTKLVGPAVDAGLKVALIEKDRVGGTCLNRGCIPSKMLIYPAEIAEMVRQAARFGLHNTGAADADMGAIVRRINAAIDGQSASLRNLYAKHPGVDFYPYKARFAGAHVLEVNGERLTADRIFVAVGARPQIPDIPGLAGTPYMTSTEALRNETLPRSLVVVGAGYIAAELGYAYGAFGTDVHFVVRSRFLRGEDRAVSDEFERLFSRVHTVHKGFTLQSVAHGAGGFTIELSGPADARRTLHADALLLATGVVPDTDGLGLDAAGVETDGGGYIRVDDRLRTTAEGVYALGDCIGRYFYRHTVNSEGEYLARSAILVATDAPLDYGPVPRAIFTHPQIAAVGQTEEEARAAGADYVVGQAAYAESTPGMARMAEHGFVKILVERESRRLLGCHIIGSEASDMIHILVVTMKMKGGLDDLLDLIFVHPALPEVVRDAARDARAKLA